MGNINIFLLVHFGHGMLKCIFGIEIMFSEHLLQTD